MTYLFGCNNYVFPPKNLNVSPNGRDMELSWEEPRQRFTHAVEGETIGFGTMSTRAFTVASRFSLENLRDFGVAGAEITEIIFMPKVAEIYYTITVWTGGQGYPFSSGEVAFSQEVIPRIAGEQYVLRLDVPLFIDPLKELWIGYSVLSATEKPAGFDDEIAKDKNNNLILQNFQWVPIADAFPGIDTSLYIKAITKRPQDIENNLEGFQLSRLNIETDYLVEYPLLSSTTFFHVDENVPKGTYLYSLKAIYRIGESEYVNYQICSENEPLATVKITLVCCCGKDPIQGALIKLTNLEDPEIEHELETESNEVTIFDVIFGEYTLLITHRDYHPHTQEIDIDLEVIELEIEMQISLDIEDIFITPFITSLGQNFPNPFSLGTAIGDLVSLGTATVQCGVVSLYRLMCLISKGKR
jgi:hypothetical protein